jgi:FkbM family methyltransferase
MRVPRFVRRATDPVLERARVPIIGGPNRGLWWNLASAGSGYVTGRRAAGQLRFFLDIIAAGEVVWDAGAHHGYVAMAFARRVGRLGEVHAFEPGERNRRILQRHVTWNGLGRIRVHPHALGSENGTVRFGGSSTSRTLAIGAGSELVSVRTMKSMIDSGQAASPDFIKVDVENAEADLLEGAGDALPLAACMVIGMHSRASDQRCTALLRAAGFTCHASPELAACREGEWHGDPDLLCVGPSVAADRVARVDAIARAAGYRTDVSP